MQNKKSSLPHRKNGSCCTPNKGFSISIFLVVIVLLVIVITYIYKNKKTETPTTPNDKKQQMNTSNTVDTTNWKTYQNISKKYSLKYPKD